MSKINSKHDLINFFENGCKKKSQLKIGVENEKFIFENGSNKRVDFKTISKIFSFLEQFGWKPIKEKNNVVGLTKDEHNISLEPGNQIELSGAKLDSIHLTCQESYKFLDELKKVKNYVNYFFLVGLFLFLH